MPLRRSATWSHVLIFLLAVVLFGKNVRSQINLTPSQDTKGAGSSLSHVMDPSYAGIGMEPSNLFAFTGTKSPNSFVMTLLNNLASYTGKPPHVRVGGNTGDTAIYQADYSGYYFKSNPDSTGPTDKEIFGPNFFKAINYFPKDTPVTYGIGMAYQGSDAIQMSTNIAQGVLEAFDNVKLNGFEVSNEPDLYVQNQFRPKGWDAMAYGDEWISHVQAIYNQVLKPRKMPQTFFEAACTATTASNRGFRIEDLVKTGLKTDNGVWLAGWNQHNYYYYVGVSTYDLTLDILLDLSSTSGQFKEWASQAQQANVTGKPYYLREMGSVGPNGLEGISDTFGNAIWTLNFFLYASTVGVQSVELHMLQDSYGAPFSPTQDSQAGQIVRPSYYAWAAMAQIIGAGCKTQVASIDVDNTPSGYSNRIGAYAIYDAGSLQTLVAINSKIAYQSQGSGIPSQTFTFNAPKLAGKTFYLSVLTAAGADAKSGATWNGMSYEKNGDGSSSKTDENIQQVKVGDDGSLTFSVRDSQIIVANLDSQLGTQNNVVDQKACNNLQDDGNDGDNTFKATSGFASHLPISLNAIIGIAAGGGAAILLVLALCIYCCVRRRRRNRELKAIDQAALLPPKYKKGRQPYKTVPINDSPDSAEDIFMTPVNKRRDRSNEAYKNLGKSGHRYHDSVDSSNSLAGSPLQPASPSMNRARYDSHDSRDSIIPSFPPGTRGEYYQGSPKAQRNASGAVMQSSNLNPYSGKGASAATASAAAATAGAGAIMTPQLQRRDGENVPRHDGRRLESTPGRDPRAPTSEESRNRRNSLPNSRNAPQGGRPLQQTPHSHHGHGQRTPINSRPPVPVLPTSIRQAAQAPYNTHIPHQPLANPASGQPNTYQMGQFQHQQGRLNPPTAAGGRARPSRHSVDEAYYDANPGSH